MKLKGTILFVSAGDSIRGQIAKEFAKKAAPEGMEIFCSGTVFTEKTDPVAIDVAKGFGIDISENTTQPLSEMGEFQFDLIVTLDETVKRDLPPFKGLPPVVHWNIPSPAGDTEEALRKAYHSCTEQVQSHVSNLFKQGYHSALTRLKNTTDNILNSLSEGILAHDLSRKIFYFSENAAKMTGIPAEKAIGKDCHEIFPGGLCGGSCAFCNGYEANSSCKSTYPVTFRNPDGVRKECDISVLPLKDEAGNTYGIIASLRDHTELRILEQQLGEEKSFSGIIGQHHKMREVFQHIKDVADYDFPVHVFGETGTGKELVAAAIHNESPRKNKPFVPINCGALPETLIESELFGHVKGAFSGAIRDKKGRFELAEGGTVFLDEVAELTKEMQVKLLRFLQEGTFEKVGGEKTVKANVRVISATNKELKKEIKSNRFRDDLYYRLNVIPVRLPALRERKNDIPLLVAHFLKKSAEMYGKKTSDISEDALAVMMSYHWPGNVRELENAVQYSIVKSRGNKIMPKDLPIEMNAIKPEGSRRGPSKKLDDESVRSALSKSGGNKAKAARLLGVGRATLYRFLDENPQTVPE